MIFPKFPSPKPVENFSFGNVENVSFSDEETVVGSRLAPLPREGASSRGVFEINGVRFPIPPQGISITEQNQNFNFETLRTRESTKIRSGHGRVDICVTALFTGNTTGSVELLEGIPAPADALEAINETLMPILYSLKKMPLCFIDNELLRTTLPIAPGEVIGAFIRSVNVGTVPGMPYTLSAEFQFVWFNHRPYTPRIRFRKEWYDPLGHVKDFAAIYRDVKTTVNTDRATPDDSGRATFLKNYGHPSVVFNATAAHTSTDNIHEARPLLEWLWPYRYPTTNRAILEENEEVSRGTLIEQPYSHRALKLMPPFKLDSFDDSTSFVFELAQTPATVVVNGKSISVVDIARKYTKGDNPLPTESVPSSLVEQQPPTPAPSAIRSSVPASVIPTAWGNLGIVSPEMAKLATVTSRSAADLIDGYRVPGFAGKITPKQKAIADLIYTRMINAGMTPAWAIASMLQSSFESGLNADAVHPRKVAFGPFQLNTRGGLGGADKNFQGGRQAGTAENALAQPDKFYNALDPEINLSRIITVTKTYKYLRRASENRNLSPAKAFETFFWSTLGVGGDKTPHHVDLFNQRDEWGRKHVKGWDDPLFNAGSRSLPSSRLKESVNIISKEVPYENRYNMILDPIEALALSIENNFPSVEIGTRDEAGIVALARQLGATNSEASLELIALADAVDQGSLFVRHAITGKIAQIRRFEISLDNYFGTVVPMNVAVTFGTNIVMMPLDGHRFATTQYTGGQQTAATISFRVATPLGRQFLRDFQDLVNAYEHSAIAFREFAKRRAIEIYNPLLNSININSVLLETTNIDTIPGSPDDLNIVMRLVDNTINDSLQAPILPVEEKSFDTIGVQILNLLLQKGWITAEAKEGETVKEMNTGRSVTTETETYADGLVVKSNLGAKGNALQTLLESRNTNKIGGGEPLLDKKLLPDGRYAFYYSRAVIYSPTDQDPLSYPERTVEKVETQTNATSYPISLSITPNNYGPEDRAKTAIDDLIVKANFSFMFTEPLGQLVGTNKDQITAREYGEEIGRTIPCDDNISMPRNSFRLLYGDKETRGFVSSRPFNRWASTSGRRLISSLGRPNNGKALDPDFAAMFSTETAGAIYEKTNQAYPDLILPPNPISGLCIDTNPDFFLVNDSDLHHINSNTMRIIHGNADKKLKGMKAGLTAIDVGHENFLDIHGVGTGGGLEPANRGRQDVYTNQSNRGIFKTSLEGQKLSRATEVPEVGFTLAALPGREAVVENNIAYRNHGQKYKRDISMGVHYDQSAYRDIVVNDFMSGTKDGEQLENLVKIQHSFSPDTYKEMFSKFCENYESTHYTVRRAFPTFKIFFVEEDGELDAPTPDSLSGEVINMLATSPALDDFYGVNAIKEISVVHNKADAVSTCVIQVLDLDGVLYNRKFDKTDDFGGLKDLNGPINSGGSVVHENKLDDKDNPFFSTMIKEGMKVIVKFGYSNDPTQLDTIFIGQVAQFEGNQVITIVCQSYGAELVAKQFGSDPSKNVDLYNTTTADLVHDTMDREEVRHFGRWRLSDIDALGELLGHEKLRPDGRVKTSWTWRPSVVDDNIFVPPADEYASFWARLFGDLKYVFWNTTIWDVFKEMELRHPGYIAYPVPYSSGIDGRMTMFFGHPDMYYLARPATDKFERDGEFTAESVSQLELREVITRIGRVAEIYDPGASEVTHLARGYRKLAEISAGPNPEKNLRLVADQLNLQHKDILIGFMPLAKETWNNISRLEQAQKAKDGITDGTEHYDAIDSDSFYRATMTWQADRLRPFRNYELVTSIHDILRNNIRTDHRDTFNSVELHYSDGGVNFGTFARDGAPSTLTVNADDNIKEHHIRRTIEAWPNCTTTDLARRYASQLLANSIMKTYKGELVILGKPHLKPYDVVWLDDSYSDMAGPIEIEEVVHTFSQETGFITEIVPNMIVTVAGDAKMLMVDAIGKFFSTTARDFTHGALLGLSVATTLGTGIQAVMGARAASAATSKAMAEKAATGELVEVGSVTQSSRVANGLEDAEWQMRILQAKAKQAWKAAPGTVRSGVTKSSMVGAGTSAALAASMPDSEGGITDQNVAGFATGAVAGAGLFLLPITTAVSGIVAGALLYKFLKYNSTREPILITPLIKDGKPYVTGLEGFETDGLLCGTKEGIDKAFENSGKKWTHFIDGIDNANEIVSTGWNNFWAGD